MVTNHNTTTNIFEIHPTRVDSSLVFAIRLTGNRFVNPIPLNPQELFPFLSIRHAVSQLTRENIADLGFEGGLKMLSNRHKSYESTEVCGHVLRTRKIHVSLFHGSWLPVDYAGWVENVVESTRIVSLLSICHAGSRVVWDTTQCESSRVIKCLIRIDWSLLPHFNTEEDSCITISQTLISGSADWRRASWVESLSASDELIQFGCIGHGCLKLAKRFWKPETITDYGKWKIWNTKFSIYLKGMIFCRKLFQGKSLTTILSAFFQIFFSKM